MIEYEYQQWRSRCLHRLTVLLRMNGWETRTQKRWSKNGFWSKRVSIAIFGNLLWLFICCIDAESKIHSPKSIRGNFRGTSRATNFSKYESSHQCFEVRVESPKFCVPTCPRSPDLRWLHIGAYHFCILCKSEKYPIWTSSLGLDRNWVEWSWHNTTVCPKCHVSKYHIRLHERWNKKNKKIAPSVYILAIIDYMSDAYRINKEYHIWRIYLK